MGVVNLCIEVGLQTLLTVLTCIPCILVVHLSTNHQPQVGCKDRRIQFHKTIGIVIPHLTFNLGISGIVGSRLCKEDSIVLEGMRVREHHPAVTIVGRYHICQVGIIQLLLMTAKHLESFDDEPVLTADTPIQIKMHILSQSTVCHAIDIGWISLSVRGVRHGIRLHGEFLRTVGHIGIEHPITIGATLHRHFGIGLEVVTIIDIYQTFRTIHRLSHRGVAAYLDTLYLTSLHVGEE